MEQFKIDGVKIKKIAFSPDDKDLTLKESYDNHFNSNIAQFFVGGVGAVSVSYEGLANGRIKMHVQFSNETSMSSLFLHLSEDVHRIDTDKNYDGTYPALSTITQVFDFYIYADATERLFLYNHSCFGDRDVKFVLFFGNPRPCRFPKIHRCLPKELRYRV